MKTTIQFNIKSNAANAQSAYNELKDAGLNPAFAPRPYVHSTWLEVEVDTNSDSHSLAKKYLFDNKFNSSK